MDLKLIHHLSLDDESLSKAKLEYLTYIERKLRFKGWKTKVKFEAASVNLWIQVKYHGPKMR